MTGKHDIDDISLADNYLVHGGLHTIIKMIETKFHRSVYGSLKKFWVGVFHARKTWIWSYEYDHIDGLMQEGCNSRALAMELPISCTNPVI